MVYFSKSRAIGFSFCLAGMMALFAVPAKAQYGGGGSTGGGSTSTATTGTLGGATFHPNYHLGFDRPEAWGLKYFASTTMLSGLQPPEAAEARHVGSISVAFETGWLPTLDAGQQRIGFHGTAPEDLNKVPILTRAVVRVGLPDKFTLVAAAPPPFHIFGVTPHLLAFGLERPLWENQSWTLSWRGYGQVGTVKGAFTCPQSVLSFDPGSPQNPARCLGQSADVATLRYAGSEFQLAYRIPGMPKLVPHIAAGGNFIDGVFQVHAPVTAGLDETREWTRGGTFSGTAGLSYLLTRQLSFTVDMFYSPLEVQRSRTSTVTNDGLLNVRALLSYNIR